ncbi:hypothetical protein EUAN_03820 [Andreesenia angusta]|uniref:Uncharacterized protein n=1 Tax=Andreesenia angusta TaxID=39480 RepID=A0A1S1VAA6_9FIRM|nr:hypothetical protein [Andreesenia angusta]OHW63518.1 hypothetical protein EUAN_03820 [Andreesenia angusta]
MKSAMDYAKAQKRNGHIALAATLAITTATIAFTYFVSTGVLKNVSLLFLLGLGLIIVLFGISTALFYGKANATERIMKDPLVHWTYNSEEDEWLEDGSAEAIISEEGIYYSPANNRVHTFWSPSSKLEHLKLGRLPGYDCTTMNFFFIRARTQEGNTISAALHVPVPNGQEAIAEQLVERLNHNLKTNRMNRVKFLTKVVLAFIAIVALIVLLVRLLGI